MSENPKVSIIMPSLNVEKYIEQCILSAINQSMREIEIICIDAGSTDKTLNIIEKYASMDDRIVIIHSDVRSYGYQVNVGIQKARGEYIAILETDDWVHEKMYETLYESAEINNLDYVAADFDFVYELREEKICRYRFNQFSRKSLMYGRVLSQDDINKLRTSDYVLWKGIYNRNFLLMNRIILHESPKAAYQDMGFLQQVKTYATRAMYIDESFYRYRIGRAGSSTCSMDGLLFYMNEFMWLNSELKLIDNMSDIQITYYFHTMSIAFLLKYKELLRKLNWNYKDKRLTVPYSWFANQLGGAISDCIITEAIYDVKIWNELKCLIKSEENYASAIKDKYENDMKNYMIWEKSIQRKKVIVFGCGKIGLRTLRVCDVRNINIEFFADNNKYIQEKGYNGYKVLSVSEIKTLVSMDDYIIVIAVKNKKNEILEQLRNNNIVCSVVDYPSDIVIT